MLGDWYQSFLAIPGQVIIGGDQGLVLSKPLIVWVNDLWMAAFFFLVGLEIKREFLSGELSGPGQVTLPALSAVGGMAVPALIYVFFNQGDPLALKGWAIPAATDIAFALGIVVLLGSKVPLSLKVFLTAVAIQPISIAIEADTRSFQLYKEGIYNDQKCGTTLDHAVAIVGYDTTQKYFILRNSWGTSWGENGYMRIEMADSGNGICGMYMTPSYPTF
jgi:hypothetical protein